jgi:hypothetical protein
MYLATYIDFLGEQAYVIVKDDGVEMYRNLQFVKEFFKDYNIFILINPKEKNGVFYEDRLALADDVYGIVEYINFTPIIKRRYYYLFAGEIIGVNKVNDIGRWLEIESDKSYIHCYYRSKYFERCTWYTIRPLSNEEVENLLEMSYVVASWLNGENEK